MLEQPVENIMAASNAAPVSSLTEQRKRLIEFLFKNRVFKIRMVLLPDKSYIDVNAPNGP
jgi:hypothetical protein